MCDPNPDWHGADIPAVQNVRSVLPGLPYSVIQPVAQSPFGRQVWGFWNAGAACEPAVLIDLETWLLGGGAGQLAFGAVPVQLAQIVRGAGEQHSFSHAMKPRRDIMVSFWQALSCPNAGSTVRARIL